ncbi:MAG: type II toxin-antitoxin system HicA family toxin [Candidatus Hydrogenedentes bacterium]|nr:type II toxin-antitoxin system HicA family toxin [Candidatus Hydrogenedentota bacterium]
MSPKQPRLTAVDADRMLISEGYILLRTKGSHRVYMRGARRVVVPYHAVKILHPKIVKQILAAIEPEE